jgi:hypothetical protein
MNLRFFPEEWWPVYVPDFEGDCEAEFTEEEGQRCYEVLIAFLRMQKLICEKFGVPMNSQLEATLEELDDLEDVIKFHVKDVPPEGWE